MQSNAIKSRPLNKVMVMSAIYRGCVNRKRLTVIKNAYKNGPGKRSCPPARASPKAPTFGANLSLAELNPSVQQQVIALKDQMEWAHRAGNVLLIGPSGVGKSHMAAAIASHLIEQNVRVKWFTAVALVQSLQQAKRDLDLMTAMTRLDKYQVVVIDDIGYVNTHTGH